MHCQAVRNNRKTMQDGTSKTDEKDAASVFDLLRQGKFFLPVTRDPELKAAYRLSLVIVEPLGACVVDKELLLNCLNGLPLRALTMPKEVTEMCKHCDEPVRYLPVCQCRWSRT